MMLNNINKVLIPPGAKAVIKNSILTIKACDMFDDDGMAYMVHNNSEEQTSVKWTLLTMPNRSDP